MRAGEDRMPRPDEGLIHAWLDGELDAAEAARVERLVATDTEWAAAAAEARGLIAASSRIVRALDVVPGDVIPRGGRAAPAFATGEGRNARAALRRVMPTWLRMAAVFAFVAGVSYLGRDERAERTAPTAAVANDGTNDAAVDVTAGVAAADAAPERSEPAPPPSVASVPAPPPPASSVAGGMAAPLMSAKVAAPAAPALAPNEAEVRPAMRAAMRDRSEALVHLAGCWRVSTRAMVDSTQVSPRIERMAGDTLVLALTPAGAEARVVRRANDQVTGTARAVAADSVVPFEARTVRCPE